MAKCASCGIELASSVRFCSSCGAPAANTDDVPTIDFSAATSPFPASPNPASPRPSSAKPSRPPSASSLRPPSSAEYLSNEGRFLPGRLIAGRYRIIALLGKGGMGEVYRADDLTLGQAVALKFLPDEAARDEGLLERFRNEVRIARRVSHPNVCRVYDVGDVDGQTFFTMEYVDGEDLASLLRRIGRLPQDKAIEIARQLCAGLAAAHAKGVLHRDLKPANIMLDGRGQAVIMDFGLAGIADDIRGSEIRSGTPAYMSPEQLAGTEVSPRSDIYSLGLVLYEVFTGKRAFAEKTAETASLHGHADRTPSRPSSVVKDLDPIVEKVILRCLETSASARPATALAVAAALPGGDPLAAALAAGETPSPKMVAAAGETTGLRPQIAIACLVATLIGLAIGSYLTIRYSGLARMQLELTPEVLAQKAREMTARLGYPERPVDTAFGLDYNDEFKDAVEKNDKPRPNWDAILAGRPSLLFFWYRQSPDTMFAQGFRDQFLTPGIVNRDDPAPTLSGMLSLELDPKGRLIYFQAIPPQEENAAGPATTYDWNGLFAEAGLDPAKFQKADPLWNSLAAPDTRAAWTGTWPGTTRPLRVEASAWRGKPVFFRLIGDWTKAGRMKAPDDSTGKKASSILSIVILMAGLLGSLLLARRNYRQGRCDREGAFRLASVMFVLEMLLWLCRSHFTLSLDVIGSFAIAISTGLFITGITWILYLALEPWVRRRWPHAIISWSRLLAGQFRDPLVSRDILFGVMLGVVWILIFEIHSIRAMYLASAPVLGQAEFLMGGREALGAWLIQIPGSILSTLFFFMLLLGLKALLRKDWLAAIAFVAIYALPGGLTSSHPALDLPTQILAYAIAVLIVFRFGLIPLAVAIFIANMLGNVPLTADFSAWYMGASVLAVLSVVVLAGWGFYYSLGGAQVWKVEME
ncbi:MAG TPA: serine/threonine-protein kinase [Terriglobales bacterium]|nr:serine/threonine-protein kinase [Terriglobales bacterium]